MNRKSKEKKEINNFSGKNYQRKQILKPFSLGEIIFDENLEIPYAPQLRHSYELGEIASLKQYIYPNSKLSEDEKAGLKIFNNILKEEFKGEVLGSYNIVSVSKRRLLIEVENEAKSIHEIIYLTEDPKFVVPIEVDEELVFYKNGLPLAVTKNVEHARSAIVRYYQEIIGKLPRKIINKISLPTFHTFDLEEKSCLFRVYDWYWEHNPYALVLAKPEAFDEDPIGRRLITH